MLFDLEEFKASPSQEMLASAKKTDLLNLAKHYGVTEAKSAMRKQQILNILVDYFVDEEILDETSLALKKEATYTSETNLDELKLSYNLS